MDGKNISTVSLGRSQRLEMGKKTAMFNAPHTMGSVTPGTAWQFEL